MKPARLLFRADKSAGWQNNNPVLMLGEPGYDVQSSILRIGDGRTNWNNLKDVVGQVGPTGERGELGDPGEVGDSGEPGPTGPTGPGISSGIVFRKGTNYGNYYYWNDSTAAWVIGSTKVNLGTGAGEYEMEGSVAIGHEAGNAAQGEYSVAIGSFAGKNYQANNSIVLNASGEELDSTASGFFVKPLHQARNPAGGVPGSLWYNSKTGEICYN
jgi:hypothetical protein